jgi:2-oxoglutarate ferredoxin oxidoreductase subunit delta
MARTKARITITVTEEFCKGCGLCVAICPQQAMQLADRMNSRGIQPAYLAHPDDCNGCTQCAIMCPDACLRITRSER